MEITFWRIKLNQLGLNLLYLAVVMLPTAPAISVIFLLFSLILSKNNHPFNFFKDDSNRIFLIISFLMILSCIFNSYSNSNLIYREISNLSWISLINWIPFFWSFWGFQPYLSDQKVRKKIAKLLIIGTIPVIFSGALQYFFKITGPFEIFNGLIIWYQKPLSITDGMTGPFNNINYAGSWFALVCPFSIAFLRFNTNKYKKSITSIICLLIIISLILTNSRNAWLGMLITFSIMLSFESILWIIPLILIIGLMTTFLISLIPLSTREFFLSYTPINLFNNFPENSFSMNQAFPRINIWSFAVEKIAKRPLLGWGGGAFPILYENFNGKWVGHPHNIIFELAINYGVFTALTLASTIIMYIYKFYKWIISSTKKSIFPINPNLIFEKAWFASILVLTFSHLFDIQYFDLRISIIAWILLSGLKASMI